MKQMENLEPEIFQGSGVRKNPEFSELVPCPQLVGGLQRPQKKPSCVRCIPYLKYYTQEFLRSLHTTWF